MSEESKKIELAPTKPPVAMGQRGVSIKSLDDLWRFGEMVARSGLAPKNFTRPEQVCVAVAHGLEIGLSPMQSLQGLAVIEGKVGLYTQTARALVEACSECEYVKDDLHELGGGEIDWKDNVGVTARVKRRGRPEVVRTFTVAHAKRAKLWNKVGPRGPSAWVTYPGRMLYNRAMGFALGDGFPDVLKGLRTVEELQDYPPEGPQSGATLPPADLDEIAEGLEHEQVAPQSVVTPDPAALEREVTQSLTEEMEQDGEATPTEPD